MQAKKLRKSHNNCEKFIYSRLSRAFSFHPLNQNFMSSTTDVSYIFGGFTLNPVDRILLYSNDRVDLTGKDFEVLLYLVENPNRLIRSEDLVEAIWGDKRPVDGRNVAHHVAKVRRALDCDRRYPTFIGTVHGKGYRFLADVQKAEMVSNGSLSSEDRFKITSHMFVPVLLGPMAYESVRGTRRESQWLTYKEFQMDDGRLCLAPNGVGIWHQTVSGRFSTMSEIAAWRRENYDQILSDKHALRKQIKLLLDATTHGLSMLKLGELGYVFSALIMEEPRLTNGTRIRNSLRLLACLTPLESKARRTREQEAAMERQILEFHSTNRDMREFGLGGTDCGFASWNGVSYYQFTENAPGLESDIVEFEIAVQGVWWFSKCLADETITRQKLDESQLAKSIDELKGMFARLENIGPMDTTSQRTMFEAVLSSSRLERLVNETINQYERL